MNISGSLSRPQPHPHSVQRGRVSTLRGSLLSFTAIEPMDCADCGALIAVGEPFTRPWCAESHRRQAVCQACLPFLPDVDPDIVYYAGVQLPHAPDAHHSDVAISDAQWAEIAPHVPTTVTKHGAMTDRAVLEAVLYRLTNRCTWTELPASYGRWQACRWRYQRWIAVRALPKMLDAFLATLAPDEYRCWAQLLMREEVPPTVPG